MISDEGQMRAAVAMESAAENLDEALNRAIARLDDTVARFEGAVDKAVERLILHDQYPH